MPAQPPLPSLGTVSLEGYNFDLDHFLTKPYDDIQEAAQELPALIEWINMQLQAMIEQKLIKKQEIAEVEAACYFDLRNEGRYAELGYSGKATEGSLAYAIALDSDVKRTHREYAVLSGWVSRLANLQNSLQSKLELIRSTEATRRSMGELGQDNTRERE